MALGEKAKQAKAVRNKTEYWSNPDKYRQYNREQYQKHRSKRLAYHHKNNLERRYGINLEEYEKMTLAQGGYCAICKSNKDKLYLDHCHKTVRARGLLCPKCNTGIGMFLDNPELLMAAIEYLGAK